MDRQLTSLIDFVLFFSFQSQFLAGLADCDSDDGGRSTNPPEPWRSEKLLVRGLKMERDLGFVLGRICGETISDSAVRNLMNDPEAFDRAVEGKEEAWKKGFAYAILVRSFELRLW